VLARGDRLRRRRRAVRAAGVTAVVGTVAATGTLVLARDGDRSPGDVQTAQTTPETTAAPPQPLFADPFACVFGGSESDSDDRAEAIGPTPIGPEEVRDEVRLLPTWTPDGLPITSASGAVYDMDETLECTPAVAVLQDTLDLTATGADGLITAKIVLEGPYSLLAEDDWGITAARPTQVRGQEGRLIDPSAGDDAALEWTEPDGSAWRLRGTSAAEADLLAVAEALQLDSSPDPGVPPAKLAPGDVPAGYEVVEQAAAVPTQAEPQQDDETWRVVVGTPSGYQTGILCHVDVWDVGDGEPSVLPDGVGSRPVAVGSATGVWTSQAGSPDDPDRWGTLSWQLGPGLEASVDCSNWDDSGGRTLPIEDVVRLAESLEPVAADDPRIPPPGPTG
jgi:hypothetical protein